MIRIPEPDQLAAQTTDLLRELIRNACVNEGTVESGQEIRNAETIASFLEGSGTEVQILEPRPGRASLVTRLPGSGGGETLALVGHTDVVPAEPSGWSRDPFAADLVDGWVWGRGAIDMLGLTAAFAVVTKAVAASGTRLHGDLLYAAVADEENGSRWGVDWLTSNHWDLMKADHVLTESGGVPVGPRAGHRTFGIGEKGGAGRTLRITGRPGHGSGPWGSLNAIVLAGEVVQRISRARGPVVISDLWRQYVDALELPERLREASLDPERLDDVLSEFGSFGSLAHATTHTTVAPTVFRSGSKRNVIPGEAEISLDIRILPGTRASDVDAFLVDIIGDLRDHVEVLGDGFLAASLSPVDTPFTEVVRRSISRNASGARLLPTLGTGGTDARFYRQRGIPAYGFGLLSPAWDPGTFRSLFHGNDERIDVASLRSMTAALVDIVSDFTVHPR